MAKATRSTSPQPSGRKRLSRRAFLKGTGLIAAAGSAGTVISSCAPAATGPAPTPTPFQTIDDKYLHAPPPPDLPPDPDVLLFFTPQEARAIEAMTARILPGTPEDPGAREAGVVIFIDRMLATTDGYAEPTYTQPPFPRFYSGDQPPPEAAETDPNEVIWVPEEWKDNFGWQMGAPPQLLYRLGIGALNQMAGGSFADLSEAEQDALLMQMSGDGDDQEGGGETGQGGEPGQEGGEGGDAFEQTGVLGFSASAFFDMVKRHTVEGMFGDPLYGGNRFLVGWQLVNYPGARRAYTEDDMHNEQFVIEVEPQSLAGLPPFRTGQKVSDEVIVPPYSGTRLGESPYEDIPQKTPEQLLAFCRIRRD